MPSSIVKVTYWTNCCARPDWVGGGACAEASTSPLWLTPIRCSPRNVILASTHQLLLSPGPFPAEHPFPRPTPIFHPCTLCTPSSETLKNTQPPGLGAARTPAHQTQGGAKFNLAIHRDLFSLQKKCLIECRSLLLFSSGTPQTQRHISKKMEKYIWWIPHSYTNIRQNRF